jgi:zinc finger SWIM domain-containing protein 3
VKQLDGNDSYISIEEVSQDEENYELVVSCMDERVVPCIGMRFNTHKEAYNFYNSYAGRVGFSVRKQCTSKSKKGVSSMRFVCSKYGFGKRQKIQEMTSDDPNLPKTPEKVRAFTRVGCNASFRIKLVEGTIWEVSVFEENHNHPLVTSPSKRRNLRSQK